MNDLESLEWIVIIIGIISICMALYKWIDGSPMMDQAFGFWIGVILIGSAFITKKKKKER